MLNRNCRNTCEYSFSFRRQRTERDFYKARIKGGKRSGPSHPATREMKARARALGQPSERGVCAQRKTHSPFGSTRALSPPSRWMETRTSSARDCYARARIRNHEENTRAEAVGRTDAARDAAEVGTHVRFIRDASNNAPYLANGRRDTERAADTCRLRTTVPPPRG